MTFSAYLKLANRMKELKFLSNSISMLHWDSKTYMPPNGIQQRGSQISLLSKISHKRFISPKNGDLLKKCEKNPELSEIERRNVELWRRDYDKATKLPPELVEKLSKQQVLTEHLWEEAKAKSDFQLVLPELKKLVELVKEKADKLDPDTPQYDTLIDIYEPETTAEQIMGYFNPLKKAVLKMIDKCQGLCIGEDAKVDPDILKVECIQEQQTHLSDFLMKFTGLDPERSRIDTSEHPFTTGYADDVRITTHYLENDPMGSLYSVLHEAGHALYELNLPKDHLWTAIGDAISLGVHESQSRFNENIIGKNPSFIEYIYPKVFEFIPGYKKKDISLDEFTKAINAIKPSKIRIYADEVTYNLHIIMRFEIERDLFAGKISVEELPQVWNEKMDKYLQQEIEEDKKGVLQDTHWYGGSFGYFPTYSIGNIYGGQMLHTMKKDINDWNEQLRMGQYDDIRNWLITNVHQKGSMYDPRDLIEEISGEKPDAKYFISYMEKKFGKIYDF